MSAARTVVKTAAVTTVIANKSTEIRGLVPRFLIDAELDAVFADSLRLMAEDECSEDGCKDCDLDHCNCKKSAKN